MINLHSHPADAGKSIEGNSPRAAFDRSTSSHYSGFTPAKNSIPVRFTNSVKLIGFDARVALPLSCQ
jgi:hypothetical protein